jgi:FMN-dependent oxidoreductase (nitrilotriacetate monooxygenase family)
MARAKAELRLGAFFNPTGHHVASWRHERAQADAGINFKHYVEIAQTAERGKFDMIFLADNVCVREAKMEALSRSAQYIANFEPITLISALAGVTDRIGLTCTASTSYNEPFHVARKFASLDHISGGRAGWNLVTSGMAAEALNFNRDAHYGHAERYERANEFAEIVTALWDSWDDDAFMRDKASGNFFDPAKLHVLNHKGKHFSVRGPLNVPRSPQGRPVIFQAGDSEEGREFAAAEADAIFSRHGTKDAGRAFYSDVKGRMAKYGRDRDQLKVLPAATFVLADTDAEAHELADVVRHQQVSGQTAIRTLEQLWNRDLSGYDPDGPLPKIDPDLGEHTVARGRASVRMHRDPIATANEWRALAEAKGYSIRELVINVTGRQNFIGSARTIAETINEYVQADAADGFILVPHITPDGLTEFAEKVVPLLQERGVFRTEYTGTTLRDHLGLDAL